jgi:hypothetical protein
LLDLLHVDDDHGIFQDVASSTSKQQQVTSWLEWPRNHQTGERVAIGDGWSPIDWLPFLKLLHFLIVGREGVCCIRHLFWLIRYSIFTLHSLLLLLTASSSHLTIHFPAGATLPAPTRSLLLHSHTINMLILLARNKSRARLIAELLACVSWNDQELSDSLVTQLMSSIEEREYDEQRAHFRVLNQLLMARDDCFGELFRIQIPLFSLFYSMILMSIRDFGRTQNPA